MPQKFDECVCRCFAESIREAHEPYGVTEIAAFGPDGTQVGFFRDADAMVQSCSQLSGQTSVYYGLNPRHSDLYGLAPERLARPNRRGREEDIVARTFELLDIDVRTPGRKQAGTRTGHRKAPCTRAEHEAAVAFAGRVRTELLPGAGLISTNGAQLVVPTHVNDEFAVLKAWSGAPEGGTPRSGFYTDGAPPKVGSCKGGRGRYQQEERP